MSAAGRTHWARVETLFHTALEHPADERRPFVESAESDDDVRKQVLELLAGHAEAHEDFLEPPSRAAAPDADAFIGRRVGRYTIVRRLGAGGVGAVFEAEQDAPRRSVAIKILRAPFATDRERRRFADEAEALGRLRHPHVAQVLESGAYDDGTRGAPWYAMEFVAGARSITEAASGDNLDDRARIALLLAAGDAVAHCHQHGVIHRDLKPGNVVVGADGAVKVIDFGLARVDDLHRTLSIADGSGLFGTLAYMSPERLMADPGPTDVRADVYALGVMLYELLTDQRPHDTTGLSLTETLRVVRDEPPVRPRRARPDLPADLEAVVLRAIATRADDRYQSVVEFVADLRRYLAREPVSARAPSPWYELRLLAARHRAVTMAAAIVLIALAGATVVSTVFAVRATRSAASEARARRNSDEAVAFLGTILSAPRPEVARGRDATVVEVLDDAARTLSSAPFADPAVAGTLEGIVGRSYVRVGRFAEGEQHLRTALERARERVGADARDDAIDLLIELASVRLGLGDADEAQVLVAEALQAARRGPGEESWPDARARVVEANTLVARGRIEEGLDAYRAALDIVERTMHPGSRDALAARSDFALALIEHGRAREAEPILRSVLDRQMALDPEHPQAAVALNNLAWCAQALGETERAAELYERGLDLHRRVYGPDHPLTGLVLANLGRLRMMAGRTAEAESLFEEARQVLEATLGPTHDRTADVYAGLAWVRSAQGRHAEAEALSRRAVDAYRTALGPAHRRIADALGWHARDLLALDRTDEALALQREALTMAESLYGDAHESTALALNELATTLSRHDRDDEAEPLYRRAVDIRRRVHGPDHPYTLLVEHSLGRTLDRLGRSTEALPLLEHAVNASEYGPDTPGDRWRACIYRSTLARCLASLGRAEAARDQAERAMSVAVDTFGADDPRVHTLRDLLPELGGAGTG